MSASASALVDTHNYVYPQSTESIEDVDVSADVSADADAHVDTPL